MSEKTTMFDLTGRVALVTGSNRGIGNVLARGLAEAGATVVVHGRDEAAVVAAAAELEVRHPGRVRIAVFDVTAADAVDAGVRDLERTAGRIDILINNAGVQVRRPLLELPLQDWERVFRTNVTSAFLVSRCVAPAMIERGSGKIVNIASIQAELARPTIAAYTAAKGGLRNLTRAMAAEWAGSGLQVNAIAPGYIHTDMTQALVDDPAFDGWVRGRTPASRWGRAQDLVGPAVWLASDGSDFVNGQTIFVDGGMSVVV